MRDWREVKMVIGATTKKLHLLKLRLAKWRPHPDEETWEVPAVSSFALPLLDSHLYKQYNLKIFLKRYWEEDPIGRRTAEGFVSFNFCAFLNLFSKVEVGASALTVGSNMRGVAGVWKWKGGGCGGRNKMKTFQDKFNCYLPAQPAFYCLIAYIFKEIWIKISLMNW